MDESARHSLRISGKHAEQLLDNFGKIIHYQSCLEEDSGQDQLRTLSRFTRSVENLVPDLLPFSSQPKLIPKILKILHFLNFPSTEISVCLMHRSAQAITFTFFLSISISININITFTSFIFINININFCVLSRIAIAC